MTLHFLRWRAAWPVLALLTLSVALSGCRLTDLPDATSAPTPTATVGALATSIPTQAAAPAPTLAAATPTTASASNTSGTGNGTGSGSGGGANTGAGGAPVNGPLAEQEAAVQVVDKVGPA